jgi:hypothetical protein
VFEDCGAVVVAVAATVAVFVVVVGGDFDVDLLGVC